jgi:hypothetical protein
MIAAISIAVLLGLVQVYIDIEWISTSGEIGRLRGSSASSASQLGALQGSVDALKQSVKHYDADIGPGGSIQLLAKGLESGNLDLSLRSLKIVSNGRALVSLASGGDGGGVVQVVANDGTGSAELSAAPGRGRLSIKATTGAEGAQIVHLATYAGDGLYLQKGATDDLAARTDGAGFQIQDAGSSLFLAQSGGGNIAVSTSAADERAKVALWQDGSPKRALELSTGAKDASPYVSVSGAPSGYSMTLVPDRLSLLNQDGDVTLAAAGDANGGFVVANDKAGERRAIMASGTDGHGIIGVYGSDGRSNTLFPEFNIQKSAPSQK